MAGKDTKLSLWGIEIFRAIAEEGSVSGAAGRLDVSASSISQHLSNLEGVLKAPLFERSSRPLKLTISGRLFLERAQTILHEMSLARGELLERDLQSLSQLRMGVIEDFEAHVTPKLIGELSTLLVNSRFNLETGATHTLKEGMQSRRLDVIVSADVELLNMNVALYLLMREPYFLIAPKKKFNKKNYSERLDDFPFVRYSRNSLMGRQIDTYLVRNQCAYPNRFELDSYPAIMSMVASGLGWSILTPSGYLHTDQFHDDIDIFPLPFGELHRDIILYARAGVGSDMPAQIAKRMRRMLEEIIIAPMVSSEPWLEGKLTLLA